MTDSTLGADIRGTLETPYCRVARSWSPGYPADFRFHARLSPALLKVVKGPGGRQAALQPVSFGGDLASASSWHVSDWVEKQSYGLVSDFTAENFSR